MNLLIDLGFDLLPPTGFLPNSNVLGAIIYRKINDIFQSVASVI